LSAAALYLDFDETRRRPQYFLALALFVLALLSKTVTDTLPAALLVVFWWRRGRLGWRRDVLPLLPWFALGAAAGLFTAWVERKFVLAEGPDFALTLLQRFLIAGRAVWFYLGKLVWPANLMFFYPRWHVDSAQWWQYLFPLAALAALAALTGLCLLAPKRRGPLAGALIFAGTLFPALGFFNVYPFIYSFVADHFQYAASLGIIVPVAAGLASAVTARTRRWAVAAAILLFHCREGRYRYLARRRCGIDLSASATRPYNTPARRDRQRITLTSDAMRHYVAVIEKYSRNDREHTGDNGYLHSNSWMPILSLILFL